MKIRHFLSLTLCLVPIGCDGPADPEPGVPESEMRFVRLAEGAPPLADTTVSFWAVRGEGREVEIHLLPSGFDDEPEEFLEFEVPGGSLLAYPDGRPFARGDSVRITITVVDPTRFVFHFEPAGLRFDPEQPARLEVSYEWAAQGGDDGDERNYNLWRQERPGDLWYRMMTLRVEELDEVEAKVYGFTKFALASN